MNDWNEWMDERTNERMYDIIVPCNFGITPLPLSLNIREYSYTIVAIKQHHHTIAHTNIDTPDT